MPKTKTGPHEGAPARLGRRQFLFGASLAIATAGAPALGASKGSTVPLDARALTELSATTATAAMRAGELKAEDYANALLDQAERNKDLKASGKDVPLFTSIGQRIGPGSCASLACLVLPAGSTRSGLPVGLEFDAPSGTDRRLLGLGIALEQTLKVASPRPASLGH